MRKTRLKCRVCGSPAVIRTTSWKTADFADIYCQCKNIECGHTWVMNQTYSHTLVPSGLEHSRVKNLIENLTPADRQLALSLLTKS